MQDLNPATTPTTGFSQYFGRSVWILTENRLRQAELVAEFTGDCFTKLECKTVGDAVFELLSALVWADTSIVRGAALTGEARRARFLTAAQADAVLESLLTAHQITSEILGSEPRRSVSSVKRLFDRLRLYQSSEGLLKSALDEFGNLADSAHESAELFLALERFRNYQRDNLHFDQIEVYEILLEYLSLERFSSLLRARLLPEVIIFDQPSQFFPLQRAVWSRLAGLCELSFNLDGEIEALPETAEGWVPPSRRFLVELKESLVEIGAEQRFYHFPEQSSRAPLASYLFDGAQLNAAALSAAGRGINVASYADRRVEVRAIANAILRLVRDERVSPGDVRIVCLELDPYLTLLRQEFQRNGLALVIPRGAPLQQTTLAGAFLDFLEWIVMPTPRSFSACFGRGALNFSEQLSTPGGMRQTPVELSAKVLNYFSALGLENDLAEDDSALAAVRQALPLVVENTVRNTVGSTVGNTVGSAREEELTLGEHCLDVYQGELTERAELLRDLVDGHSVVQLVWKRFFKRRQKLRLLRGSGLSGESQLLVARARALRQLGRLVRGFERGAELRRALGLSDTRDEALVKFRDLLRSSYLSEELKLDAVIATELLDTRASHGKVVFVIGVTDEAYLARGRGSEQLSILDELTLTGRRGVSKAPAIFEVVYLLARLIRTSVKVFFSAPRVTEAGEVAEPNILQLLREVEGCSAPADTRADTRADAGAAEGGNENDLHRSGSPSANSVNEDTPSVKLLRARHAHQLTEYDGLTGAETITERNLPSYSSTSLEGFAECPHLFYFEKMLKLRQSTKRNFIEEIEKHLGVVVHRALELFYQPEYWGSRDVTLLELASATREMSRACQQAFEDSKLDWNFSQQFRLMRRRVELGLDRGDDQGERGILKGALIYLALLQQKAPFATELSFRHGQHAEEDSAGKKQVEPLKIDANGRQLLVSGKIDRVDTDGTTKGTTENTVEGTFRVLDYKISTNPPSSREMASHKKLQIPLYAALLQQQGRVVTGGGLFLLGNPNRRDDELYSASKGVLLDVLTLSEDGRKRSPEYIQPRIDRALAEVVRIDEAVRGGRFHQQLETKICRNCNYRTICYRDEQLLETKLAGGNGSSTLSLVDRGTLEVTASAERQTKTSLSLSLEQQLASDITQSVVLNAGAGSGKTAVLRTRILRLILGGEALSSILAITFTEKAAAEIRQRVELSIDEAIRSLAFEGRTLSQEEVHRLIDAKTMLFSMQISTIHSFLGRLLRLEPALSGVSDETRVLSAAEQRQLSERAIAKVLGEKGQSGSVADALRDLISGGISLRRLRPELYRLARQQRKLKKIEHGLSRPFNLVLQEIEQQLLQSRGEKLAELASFLTTYIPALEAWLGSSDRLKEEQRSAFEDLLRLARLIFAECGRGGAADFCIVLEVVQELLDFLETHGENAARKSKNNPRNYWKELRDHLTDGGILELALDAGREERGYRLSQAFASLARSVAEQYRALKIERQGLDFDDLISLTHQMFSSPPALQVRLKTFISRVRAGIRHLLVDEFQDTDEEQWEILSNLFLSSETATVPAPKAFLVGDRQQAIYGFRGGDVRVFARATEDLSQLAVRELSLVDNYRSAPEIVEFINQLFESIFRQDFNSDGSKLATTAVELQRMAPRRELIVEGSDKQLGRVALLCHEHAVGEELSPRLREAEAIGRYVSQLLNDSARFHQPESIALISRSKQDLLHLSRALAALDVPFSISHSDGFYDLAELQQVELLLRVAADPNDQISLVGALRSAVFGFSDRELLQLGEDCRFEWRNLTSEQASPASVRAGAGIREWRSLSSLLPQSSALESFFARQNPAGVLAASYQAAGLAEQYQNLERLIDQLRAAETRGDAGTSAQAALEWLSAQRESGSNAPRGNRLSNPVVLTTIHGSKGLEYPCVILPFLSDRTLTDHDFLIGELTLKNGRETVLAIKTTDEGEDYQRAETFLLRQLKRQIQLERAAEERRVFYVACTRARDQLVLSLREGSAGWVRDPEGGSSVPADWIRRAIRIERDSNRDGSSDLQAHFQSGQAESVKVLIPS